MRNFETQWNAVTRKVLRGNEDKEMINLMHKSAKRVFLLKQSNAPTKVVVTEMKKQMDENTRFLTKKYPDDKTKIERYNKHAKKEIEMEMRLRELDKILKYRNLTSKEEKELIKIHDFFKNAKIPIW